MKPLSQRAQAMLVWLEMNGAQCSDVEVREEERDGKTQRGVFAKTNVTDEVRSKAPLMVIPRKTLICSDDADNKLFQLADGNATTEQYVRDLHALDEKLTMAAFIADERTISCDISPKDVCVNDEPGSFERTFTPYYNIMPTADQLHHLPINWSPEELKRLEGLDLHDTVVKRTSRLRDAYDRLQSSGLMKRTTAFDNYKAAYSNVMARAFGLFTGKASVPCMVPYGDLLNSADGGDYDISWGFESSFNGFVMRATHDLIEGSEIFDTYGASKQLELFVFLYGFIPDALIPDGFERDVSLKYADVLQYAHEHGASGYAAF